MLKYHSQHSLSILAVSLIMACSSSNSDTAECTSGESLACSCDSGGSGHRICDASGAYGSCDCTETSTEEGDGGGTGAPDAEQDAGEAGAGAGAGVAGGAGAAGAGVADPYGALLPLYSDCSADAQCESDFCFSYNNGAMLCTKTCTTNAECPAPSSGCNGKGVCKDPQ